MEIRRIPFDLLHGLKNSKLNSGLVARRYSGNIFLRHPRHHSTEAGACLLDLMVLPGLEQLVVILQATLVFGDPLLGEFAGLDLRENLLHLNLSLRIDHARPAGDVAKLGRLGDGKTHSSNAGLIHEVADEFQLM